jgi:hypothetical protein
LVVSSKSSSKMNVRKGGGHRATPTPVSFVDNATF